jgi:import inner membrane translocase subunit TIM23
MRPTVLSLHHCNLTATKINPFSTCRRVAITGSKAKPFGNSMAVMGLYFASFESYLVNTFDDVPNSMNTVAAGELVWLGSCDTLMDTLPLDAGALSGALFRSPRGPRQAAAAGLVGAVAGLGISALRTVFPSL